MSNGWITVYSGPIANASMARARLEAAGIPCLVPAETMKILDPFQTGGLIFDYQVTVPSSAVAAARKLLDDAPEDSEIRADEQELPAEFFEPEPLPQAEGDLVRRCGELSRRIRWGAVSVIGAPLAISQFVPYLLSVRRLGRKPPQHFATLAAFGIAILSLLWILGIVLHELGIAEMPG